MSQNMQWGPWKLDVQNMTLVFDTDQPRWECLHYEINLGSVNTSAQMLDWIFQILLKPWADEIAMKGLLDAFQAIFHPQERLCSLGQDLRIDASEFLRSRFSTAEAG